MVSVLSSSAVDSWFEPQSDQTKDNQIGVWCYFVKHVVLTSKSED